MKHPLVPIACAYAAGLLCAEYLQVRLSILFVCSVVVLLCALVSSSRRAVLIWPLLVLVGWTNLSFHKALISPVDLRAVFGDRDELVNVRGRLLETPSERVYERRNQEHWRSLAEVEITELRSKDQDWQPVRGRVMATMRGQLGTEFFKGQNVEIHGRLAWPSLPMAPGGFNYRNYLARKGVYYQLTSYQTEHWSLREPGITQRPLEDRFLEWAQRTLAYGLPAEERKDEPLELLWAMTLGWKPGLTGEVSKPFMKSGTMHIFAISGLHIALIAGILMALLRVMRVSRAWCGLVVIPLIWFYTAATGWQPSAVRSTLMMTIIIGGWSLRRPTDLLNSLAAAAFIILLWDPQQLFQASFQLSFFVVLSIALILPPLENLINRLLKHDPFLPVSLIPWWQRWLRTSSRWVAISLATSLAAWLGALPLTAKYFNMFSPVTLLANLVVVPASSGALASNLGSILCGAWFPWATEVFNYSGWALMLFMARASQIAANLPGAFYHVQAPTLTEIIIYYALLIATLNGWLFTNARWKWSCAGLAILALIGFVRWNAGRSVVEVTVLPLHGGHGVYVNAHGTANDWLIDCGNTNSVEFVTTPFLRAQGVNNIPRLLLTHGDLRHVGGIRVLESEFGLNEIYTSGIRFRSPAYRRLVAEFEEEGRRKLIHRGDAVGAWRVLHPTPDEKTPQADDSALVMLGQIHGNRILFLSDLGRSGQELLMEREKDLRADVVIAGLPEKSEPLSEPLLDRIQPNLIILADSETPAQRQAKDSLRGRLEHRKIPIVYTRFGGATTVRIGDKGRELKMVDGRSASLPIRAEDVSVGETNGEGEENLER